MKYNYNSFKWDFMNKNKNQTRQYLNIEVYFDLEEELERGKTGFSTDMSRTVIQVKDDEDNIKNIVKFTSYKLLEYNETMKFEVKFPLYFEYCKNYKLNLMVVISSGLFLILFTAVIYMMIALVISGNK